MTPERPTYLRLAVTGRCNLRCIYCRPEGATGAEEADPAIGALRLLVECAAAEGVRKVRLTGGEPLLRADLAEVVAAVSSVPGIRETVMTTNGLGLAGRAAELLAAGLQRVNVSVDTLRPERMARLAGRDAVAQVLAGVAEAAASSRWSRPTRWCCAAETMTSWAIWCVTLRGPGCGRASSSIPHLQRAGPGGPERRPDAKSAWRPSSAL